ncbi:MAG: aminodeoxychorismate synthase component [Pseudomonadota bacterium]
MSFYSVEFPYTKHAAAHYFARLRALPHAVWLDSAGLARYDIVCAAPHHTLDSHASEPFAQVRAALGEPLAAIADIPFAGGALGYWSYDLARQSFGLAAQASPDVPLLSVAIYDWALVIDHELKRCRLVSHCRYADTPKLLLEIEQRLRGDAPELRNDFAVQGEVTSNFSAASYRAAFAQVQRYLHAGDCYQINLAQRLSAPASGDAYAAYLALRELSPAPFSAFMDLPNAQILCASPERFLSVKNGWVETKPIKGTRPRHADKTQDAALADELLHHPKDRAENLMIVDLLRNDLGKHCAPGSVSVPKLFALESYANVHHLVSTVQGKLAEGRDALDVLRDSFPGGSITGAPKQRAMQIIDELEPHPRGVYCGVIGYVGFDGNMDSNIVIRTLVFHDGVLQAHVGGGIVADSDCAAEYQETWDKAAALLKIMRQFSGIHDT